MAEATEQQPTAAYILMPVRGTDEILLESSINSIAKQDYENIHLVICDDGNTSEYRNKLKNILKETKLNGKYTIIPDESQPSETGNIAAARNQLLSYIKDYAEDFDFIFQLDSDDCFNEINFISKAVEEMQKKQAKIGLVGFEYQSSNQEFLNELLKQRVDLERTKQETDKTVKELSRRPFEIDDFSKITTLGWTKVYSAELYKKLESVEENAKYEDFVYMYLFFLAEKNEIIGIPDIKINFTKHQTSTTATRTEKDCKDVINRLAEFKNKLVELNSDLKDEEKKAVVSFIKAKLDSYSSIFESTKMYKIVECYKKLKSDFIEKLKKDDIFKTQATNIFKAQRSLGK